MFHPENSTTLENRWFCVFCHSPYTPKTLRKAIVFDLSRYSNWFFVATTGLTSSIKIWKEDHTFIEADSIEKPMIKIHASKFCWSKISRKVYVKTIHLDYRNGVLRDYRGLTSCVIVPSSNFALREKDWTQISVSWFFESKSGRSQKSIFKTCIDFKSRISRCVHNSSLPAMSQSKNFRLWKRIHWEEIFKSVKCFQ